MVLYGLCYISSQKRTISKQKQCVEEEIEKLNQVLNMIQFKCWYYDEAIKDESENHMKHMIPNKLPEEIRNIYLNAHRKLG